MLFIRTPPYTSVGIWDLTVPAQCYHLFSSNKENMLHLVST